MLHELGMVLDLKPGDILIFQSSRITHFNLHSKGIRGSIVLHSDKVGRHWAKTMGGWKEIVRANPAAGKESEGEISDDDVEEE